MSVTCECHFFLSVCFTSHRSWLEANAMFIAEERHCVITAVCVPFECTPESWTPSDTGTAGSHVYLRDKWYYATLRELHRGCPLESPHSAISHSYFMSLKPLYLYSSAGLERVLKWIDPTLHPVITSLWFDLRLTERRWKWGETIVSIPSHILYLAHSHSLPRLSSSVSSFPSWFSLGGIW